MKPKSKIVIILIFSSIFLVSCSNKFSRYNYKNLQQLETPVVKKELSSTVIISKEKNNDLGDFNIVGRYIVLCDRKSKEMIKIFDLESRKLLKLFGRKGQGPSEFVTPPFVIRDADDNYFWAYDMTASRIKRFSLTKILNDNFTPETIVKFKDEIPTKIIMSSENKFFASAITTKGRIFEYDKNGKIIKIIGELPVKLKDERFAKQHSHAFTGKIIYKEKTKELFFATTFGSIIERYDSESGKLLTTYYGPELFFPEYMIVPVGPYYRMEYNNKTRWGYVDVDYNKKTDEIYLLYSGIYFFNEKGRSNHGAYTNKIYVMNNKGELTKELLLDRKIHKIHLSDKGELYGATEDEIVKFKYKE